MLFAVKYKYDEMSMKCKIQSPDGRREEDEEEEGVG